jgi:hypothetical protein
MTSSWLTLQAYAFDKPIQYKNLLVYPVKMENYYEFVIMVQSLLLEKNTTLEGIQKTYLDYLYVLTKKGDDDDNLLRFDALLKLCLRKKDLAIKYAYDDETGEKPFFTIYQSGDDYKKNIKGDIYDPVDFDKLRLLILEQNDIELPDETISPAVRASMEEARRFKMRKSGTIPPTLEDQVACVMASTALRPDDIANLSIRKFGQLIQRIDMKLHYEIYLTSAMSGFVEFKDKSVLKHWMSGIDTDKWKDTTMSIEDLTEKLSGSKSSSGKK